MPRVLIIDDDRITLRVIETALKRLNYEVTTANSGEEGLKLVKGDLPDVIVTDRMMPGIDGFELTRRLRRDPSLNHIPILVLTGEAELEDKLEAFEAGADDYLSKPFEAAELAARLTALLRRTEAFTKLKNRGQDPSDMAHLVAVHSLRGGVGCSSLAVNLALAYAKIWQMPTLLMDMVLNAGHVSLMLNKPLKRNWGDLQSFAVEDLDINGLRGIISRYDEHFHYVASPSSPIDAENIGADIIFAGMQMLRPRYHYMVADLPHDFSQVTLDTLDAADEILLVLAPDMASIRAAAIALDTYEKLDYPAEKIKLVINWTFAEGGVAHKKIETALKHIVSLVVPFAPAHFINAINRGMPILTNRSEDPLVSMLEDFAYRHSKSTHKEIPPAQPSETWHRVNKRITENSKDNRWTIRSLLSMMA